MATHPRPVTKSSDAPAFLRSALVRLGWRTLSGEVVMDIGCGLGNSSRTLLELCPALRRVIALDINEGRIREAARIEPSDKIEYRVADIEDRSTLVEWNGSMSKIVSVHCFNCIRSVEEGLRNLHYLLRPGGEAAILMMLSSPFYDLLTDVESNAVWTKYVMKVHIPEPHAKRHTAEMYRYHLQSLGFEIIKCDVEKKVHTYDSDEELKNYLFQSFPVNGPLPTLKRKDFMDHLFNRYITLTERDKDGRPVMINNCLEILVRRLV